VLDGVANGLRPWFNKVGASVHDHRWLKTVEDLYVWHWKNERYLRNEDPVARVAEITAIDFFGAPGREAVERQIFALDARLRQPSVSEKAMQMKLQAEEFRGRMEFDDIAAVVHFLRKVIWIVPGFTVDRYRGRLRDLHKEVVTNGPFVATSVRFLFAAHKPD